MPDTSDILDLVNSDLKRTKGTRQVAEARTALNNKLLRKFIRKNIQPLDALLTQFGEFNVTVAGFADENTGRRLHVGTYAQVEKRSVEIGGVADVQPVPDRAAGRTVYERAELQVQSFAKMRRRK